MGWFELSWEQLTIAIEQADKLVEVFSSTRNEFDQINADDFNEYLHKYPSNFEDALIDSTKISSVIKKMNKNSATVHGDIPLKLISEFI